MVNFEFQSTACIRLGSQTRSARLREKIYTAYMTDYNHCDRLNAVSPVRTLCDSIISIREVNYPTLA